MFKRMNEFFSQIWVKLVSGIPATHWLYLCHHSSYTVLNSHLVFTPLKLHSSGMGVWNSLPETPTLFLAKITPTTYLDKWLGHGEEEGKMMERTSTECDLRQKRLITMWSPLLYRVNCKTPLTPPCASQVMLHLRTRCFQINKGSERRHKYPIRQEIFFYLATLIWKNGEYFY